MATKIDGSFSKQFSGGNDRKNSENNESQFSNFNLNQNTQKCSNFSSFVQSKNKSNFVKNSGDNVTDKEGKSWSKTSKGLKTLTLKDVNFYGNNETKKEEKVQKRWKNYSDNSESKNASTLSLHISAYEDSIEDSETEDSSETEKDSSKIALNSFSKFLDSFEFPRSLEPQQQQQSAAPQVMQFKASQKLYNPNQSQSSLILARTDPKEVLRREDYLREHRRPRELRDPFTWPWPYRAAGTAVGICVGAGHMHNLWMRKPWHYALYARLSLTIAAGILAFSLGKLRVNNYQTREAVTEHYKELHSNDFDAVNDIYGRPFANVLLPWIPKRTQYRRFDE